MVPIPSLPWSGQDSAGKQGQGKDVFPLHSGNPDNGKNKLGSSLLGERSNPASAFLHFSFCSLWLIRWLTYSTISLQQLETGDIFLSTK